MPAGAGAPQLFPAARKPEVVAEEAALAEEGETLADRVAEGEEEVVVVAARRRPARPDATVSARKS